MKDFAEFQDWLAICELKARYCRLLDTKDWAGYTALFTEDYELDVSQPDIPILKGRDAAIASVRSFIEHAVTVHQVHTPEIVVDGNQARGIWAMQDRVLYPDGVSQHGYGHYSERYVKANGQWRIATLKLTYLHMDRVTLAPPRP